MNKVRRYSKNIGGIFQGEEQFISVVAATDYDALAARVQELERELGELKEKAYRYAHWTPEHTIEEWLADRQRIVEAKQVEADAALRQQLAEAQGMVERLKNDPDYQQCCELRKQAEQQVARLREAAMQAVVDEPEMPGEMPNEMYQAVHALDREGLAEWCRIMVRATKQGIANRLEHALRETGA